MSSKRKIQSKIKSLETERPPEGLEITIGCGPEKWKKELSLLGLITKIVREIREQLEPKILKIDETNYILPDYGKCLRDYLFQYVERGREKYLPAVRNLPDYWMKVLDEHFSSSSQNETKEV